MRDKLQNALSAQVIAVHLAFVSLIMHNKRFTSFTGAPLILAEHLISLLLMELNLAEKGFYLPF